MHQFGLKNMVCNGGHGLVINQQLICNKPLDFKKVIALIKETQDLGYGVLVAQYNDDAVYGQDLLFIDQTGKRQEPTTYYINPNYKFEDFENVYKIYISVSSQEEKLRLGNSLGYLRFVENYLMFQPDDKKECIINMMKTLNENIDDVLVFGDDYNDIDMFNAS